MSAGVGVVAVVPGVAAAAVVGTVAVAAVAAAGAVAVTALGVRAVGSVGSGATWAITEGLRSGARRSGRAADACEAVLAEARAWESAVQVAAERNGRLATAVAACREAGIPVGAGAGLLVLGADDRLETIGDRLGAADTEAGRLELLVAAHRRDAVLARIHAQDPGAVVTLPATRVTVRPAGRPAEVPAAAPRIHIRSAGPAGPGGRPGFATAAEVRVAEVLADADLAVARPGERAAVDEAVSALVRAVRRALDDGPPEGGWTADPPFEVRGRISGLERVVQEVREAVHLRRAAAEEAAALVQPLLPERPGGAAAAVAAAAAVRDHLLAVMAGTRGLDDDLRLRAIAAIEEVLADADREYRNAALVAVAAELSGADESVVDIRERADGGVEVRLNRGPAHQLRVAMTGDHLVWSTVRTGAGGEPATALASDTDTCHAVSHEAADLVRELEGLGLEHEEEARKGAGGALPVDGEAMAEAALDDAEHRSRPTRTAEEQLLRRRAQGLRSRRLPPPA